MKQAQQAIPAYKKENLNKVSCKAKLHRLLMEFCFDSLFSNNGDRSFYEHFQNVKGSASPPPLPLL